MNRYQQEPIWAYTIGGIDWEFGRYEETGAYYIQNIDYPAVHQLIQAESKSEANDIAHEFIDKFLNENR